MNVQETAAWIPSVANLGEEGTPQSVELMDVTPSFFEVLGSRAALGRTFTAEDIKDNGVVLNDELWRTRFNSDPAVLGRTIRIDKLPFVVIGVMPRGFRFLSQSAKLWTPLSFSDYDQQPDQRYRPGMEMIARLRKGARVSEAQAQIDALNAHPVEGDSLASLVHKMGFHTVVRDLHADNVAGVESTLLLLQAGVFSPLMIGVVNLANLVLVVALKIQTKLHDIELQDHVSLYTGGYGPQATARAKSVHAREVVSESGASVRHILKHYVSPHRQASLDIARRPALHLATRNKGSHPNQS